MSDTPEFTPEILWHGPRLDGTLTIQTSETPNILHFCLRAFDVDTVGHVDVSAVMHDHNLLVTFVLEKIETMYLENVSTTVRELVANGEAQYQ